MFSQLFHLTESSDSDIDYIFSDDDDNSSDDNSLRLDVMNSTDDCCYLTESKMNEFFDLGNATAINLMHINCRSLRRNFDSVKLLLQSISSPLTAVCVTETWLSDSLCDIYFLPGYFFISKHRTGKIGGGVGMYLSDNLEYVIRDDLSLMLPEIECLVIEIIQTDKPNLLIGSIYRPPNTDLVQFNSDILSLLNKICNEKNKLTLLSGDFNLDLCKADAHKPTSDFVNAMLSHAFVPVIDRPTRISENSATLIDNFFINSIRHSYRAGIVYSDISDHLPIALHLKTMLQKKPVIPVCLTKRDINPKTIETFKSALSLHCWDELYNDLNRHYDATRAYNQFGAEYKKLFEHYFPIRKASNRMTPRHAWVTKGIMKSCVRKSTLYAIYCKNKTPENKSRFTIYRNKLKNVLCKAEHNYYSDQFVRMSGNMTQTWKLIKSALKSDCVNVKYKSFTDNGHVIDNKNEIVTKFNEYFVNIGKKLASSISSTTKVFSDYFNKKKTPGSFFLYPTS